MEYGDKSKDELVKELQELKMNLDSLKATYDADIAERKQIEKALRESEERFSKAYMTSPISFLIANMEDGKIIEVNDAFTKLSGFTREEALASSTVNLKLWVHEDDRQYMVATLRQGRALVSHELMLRAKNGTIYTVLFSAQTIQIGQQYCIMSSIEDITERKQAVDTLESSLSLLNTTLESTADGILVIDLNGKVAKFNQKFADMWQIPEELLETKSDETLLNYTITKLCEPEEFISKVKQLYEQPTESSFDKFNLLDGRVFERYSQPQKTGNNIVGRVWSFRDISEHRKSEEALLQKTTLFESLLNTTIDGILIIDSNGRKVFQNERTVELFNIPREFADNVDDQDQLNYVVSVNKNPDQFVQKVLYLYDHPEETSEDEIELKDGKILHRYSAPVLSKFKHNYGRIWMFRDITESKQAEKALIIAKEKAEESDRLKTAFLQNMSHEIRTPMNAIKGFSELLYRKANDKEKLKKFTDIIKQRCNDLLDIINDILDIAKIESGQLPVNIEECNLNELFSELYSFFSEYQKRIDKKHIKFSLETLCFPTDSIILTDKIKLKQIFINLISNAFKFTNEGKIEGGCKFDANQNLVFYVSDTGIGIPSDKKEVVFERFSQLHQGSKRNIGGTGLGLPIVKGLVGLLGGEIFLESEPQKGSTFSFTIPYKTVNALYDKSLIIKEIDNINFQNKTILIVEDDFYNAEYLKEILLDAGVNILHAENGNQAIEISQSQPIDIILMDVRLPDIDGYEATRQIKQHKPSLKIIAQTAYAAQDEQQKAYDAGCVDYISKPTNPEVLLSLLNKHL